MDEQRPWSRLEAESAKAYAAFAAYRDMGRKRSLDAVYAQLYLDGEDQRGTRRAPGFMKGWSVAHSWTRRAEAYDAHLEAKAQAVFEQTHIERNRQHAERAAEAQDKALDRIEQLLEEAGPQQLGALVRLYKEAVSIERAARGLVERHEQQRHADADGGRLPPPPAQTEEQEQAWTVKVYDHLADIMEARKGRAQDGAEEP